MSAFYRKHPIKTLSLIGTIAVALPLISSKTATTAAELDHTAITQTTESERTERLIAMGSNQSALDNQATGDHKTTKTNKQNHDKGESFEVATLAGGCFWCVEADLEQLDGVEKVVSGYSGGSEVAPSYEDVAGGHTTHTESVQVHYDPNVISYAELLHNFWQNIDPTDSNGQFVDRGKQYRPAIFFHSAEQRKAAQASIDALVDAKLYDKPLTIEVEPFKTFWKAEEYHQDYYLKNPIRYKFYRYGSRRDSVTDNVWEKATGKAFIEKRSELLAKRREATLDDNSSAVSAKKEVKTGVEGMSRTMDKTIDSAPQLSQQQYSKPDRKTLKKILSPIQFKVTQEDGTERAFQNEYWNEKRDGIYVDVVSGEPLFSSLHKYDSKTGWPSFYRPLEEDHIVEKVDRKLFYSRTEVRSKHGDSHLGHVFSDGPAPTGQRYCINSAALRFIPIEALEEEGYKQYLTMFDK